MVYGYEIKTSEAIEMKALNQWKYLVNFFPIKCYDRKLLEGL